MKINHYYLIVFIILSFSFSFFYLINPEKLNVKDINLIIICVFSCYLGIRFWKKAKIRTKNLFLFFLIANLILTLLSSYQSSVLYSQPLWFGIRPQRYFMIYPLFLFDIICLLDNKKITIKGLSRLLFVFSIVEMSIGFLQYFLYNYFVFTYSYSQNMGRYGGNARLYFDLTILYFCGFCSISGFVKTHKIRCLVFLFFTLLFSVVVVQGRMATLGFLFFILFDYFFLTKEKNYRKISWLPIIFIFLILFFVTPMGQDVIYSIETGDFSTNQIRSDGRAFYLNVVGNNFLGGGYINTDWNLSYIGSKMDKNFFIEDNGMFGFAFEYGWPGLIIEFVLYVISFKYAILLTKKNKPFFLSFLLYSLITSITLMQYGLKPSIFSWLFLGVSFFEYSKYSKRSKYIIERKRNEYFAY